MCPDRFMIIEPWSFKFQGFSFQQKREPRWRFVFFENMSAGCRNVIFMGCGFDMIHWAGESGVDAIALPPQSKMRLEMRMRTEWANNK